MKYIFSLFLSIATLQMLAQDYVRELDLTSGKPILRGKTSFEEIAKESVNNWLVEGADAYNPDEFTVSEIARLWHDYRFVVFAGTWCDDTKQWLPQFYKIIQEAEIPSYAVEMYCLDRKKRALQEEEKVYNIKYVPTIIVLQQKREVARIVESPSGKMEEQLLQIISADLAKRNKL